MKLIKRLLVLLFSLNIFAQNSKQALAFGNDWVATDAC